MPLYLVDSSIWIRRARPGAEELDARFRERYARGEIATCVPVALEVLVGPKDGAAYDADFDAIWAPLTWLPLRERAVERALVVQHQLAHIVPGGHRRRPTDFLVAACAEDAGGEVVLWHWDLDLTVICEHTGQAHEPESSPNARARRGNTSPEG